MAKPLEAPSQMGRAKWCIQTFCSQGRTFGQVEFISAQYFHNMAFSAEKPSTSAGYEPSRGVSGSAHEKSRSMGNFFPCGRPFFPHSIETTAELRLKSFQTVYYTAVC